MLNKGKPKSKMKKDMKNVNEIICQCQSCSYKKHLNAVRLKHKQITCSIIIWNISKQRGL